MIRRYIFGNPIPTDAVVVPIEAETAALSRMEVSRANGDVHLGCALEAHRPVYGLGENVRGIDKRGYQYVSFCSDNPRHTEDKRSLYSAHNFIIVDGASPFGLFVDCGGRVTFDIGYTDPDRLEITVQGGDFELILLEEDSAYAIARAFRQIIGQSYIPPKWGFGYQQSRWSYMSTDEIRDMVARMKEAGIPIDSVGLDIDYMERYKDFTVNPDTFGDLPALAKELLAQGIRLVPIVDAGVKIEKGYDVYEEGVRDHCFCTDSEGRDYVVAVWPGRAHFPDFLRPEVRRWFGEKYRYFVEMGIEGFWNDMNEPTIFYSEAGLKRALDTIDAVRDSELDFRQRQSLLGATEGMFNSIDDYRAMCHQIDGAPVSHERVHNLYGYNMTRSAAEALSAMLPNHRALLFSRSSYIGSHRYGGIWQGDNCSWWSHLLMNLKMLPSLNMCGYLFTGADIGGFNCDTTEDLFIRWMELGVFTPLMRNHAALSTRRQEPYLFKNRAAVADLIRVRYMLMPYLYSEYVRCALEGDLMFRPLAFDYPDDDMAVQIEDQLMCGSALMIAPVYTQNARGRTVYLPEEMLMVKLSAPEKRTFRLLGKGYHYIPLELEEMAFFLKPDTVLPLAAPGENLEQTRFDAAELLANVIIRAQWCGYDDDGFEMDYDNPAHARRYAVSRGADGALTAEPAHCRVLDARKEAHE